METVVYTEEVFAYPLYPNSAREQAPRVSSNRSISSFHAADKKTKIRETVNRRSDLCKSDSHVLYWCNNISNYIPYHPEPSSHGKSLGSSTFEHTRYEVLLPSPRRLLLINGRVISRAMAFKSSNLRSNFFRLSRE